MQVFFCLLSHIIFSQPFVCSHHWWDYNRDGHSVVQWSQVWVLQKLTLHPCCISSKYFQDNSHGLMWWMLNECLNASLKFRTVEKQKPPMVRCTVWMSSLAPLRSDEWEWCRTILEVSQFRWQILTSQSFWHKFLHSAHCKNVICTCEFKKLAIRVGSIMHPCMEICTWRRHDD